MHLVLSERAQRIIDSSPIGDAALIPVAFEEMLRRPHLVRSHRMRRLRNGEVLHAITIGYVRMVLIIGPVGDATLVDVHVDPTIDPPEDPILGGVAAAPFL